MFIITFKMLKRLNNIHKDKMYCIFKLSKIMCVSHSAKAYIIKSVLVTWGHMHTSQNYKTQNHKPKHIHVNISVEI